MSRTGSKRVVVVGAGISGVVAAAHLKKEGLDVTVFERSNAAGGVWVYDERRPLESTYFSSIQPTSATNGSGDQDATDEETESLLHAPPGPCYVGLKNNVSTRLLETSLNPWEPGTPDNVSHSKLKDYIQDTAIKTGVHDLTLYDTEVKHVQKVDNKWHIEALTLSRTPSGSTSRKNIKETFDNIIIATGHYHTPRIPNIPGLSTWKHKYPTRIHHSKSYRRPQDYKGKTFLFIGGSVSATDIARELSPFAQKIYQSQRNGAFDLPASMLPENAVRIGEVSAFNQPVPAGEQASNELLLLGEEESIPATITLKTGQKICGIDHVILCTGYHISLPYLPSLTSASTAPEHASDTVLVTDGTQYHNLHKDIFYIPDPSLLFVGVPYFTATFTLFEFQAMVVAKVLSGAVTLPSEAEMRREYEERVREKGYGKAFHSLREREVQYVDELLAWVNADLQRQGTGPVRGHTEGWKRAKEEQWARVRLLFGQAGGVEVIQEIESVC